MALIRHRPIFALDAYFMRSAIGLHPPILTPIHLAYYGQIAENGPGLLIIEPVSVTAEGKEHPKQLCIHLPKSVDELKKITTVIHAKNRLACLHLNHAGAAAKPKATGVSPKAPSAMTCPTTGVPSEPLTEAEIGAIVAGYRSAAQKAVAAGFDAIEVQGGHGYLLSQFLNRKTNQRTDRYGQNRLLFAKEVLAAVNAGAPDLIEKWQSGKPDEVRYCGYCLQGCLHRVKNGEPIGCNVNPEIGQPALEKSTHSMNVLVAGGGPAGMSAALYLSKRGHRVTLAERQDRLGGQFNLAWQASGKQKMQDSLDNLACSAIANAEIVLTGRAVDRDLVADIRPDLLVWATGAHQKIPEIHGLDSQYTMTSLEYFSGSKPVKGPRVLVIGAGRTGLEITEKLGTQGLDVTATKRTDPIGSMMEMITKKLTLMCIDQMDSVTLMPHTTVKSFETDTVVVEKDGETMVLEPFETVIFASGMLSEPGPESAIEQAVAAVEVIGDAEKVLDIYTAVHSAY